MINLVFIWGEIEKQARILRNKQNKMEDKHFEPVTAGFLAKAIVEYVLIKTERVSDNIIEQGVERLLEPHIRKPSDDDKSVPARCEEAYNEALSLLAAAADLLRGNPKTKQWFNDRYQFLQKPDPFMEADIVKEDEVEPTRIPFSLELAEQGHKVVTRDGREVRIVASDLTNGNIAFIVEKENGKHLVECDKNGLINEPHEDEDDLFILKEPETIEIRIFRGENHELHFTASKVIANEDYWTYIKTIKTTI